MKWVHPAISVVLLFAYTLVYAHNSIPHEHGNGIHLHEHEAATTSESCTGDHSQAHSTDYHDQHQHLSHRDHVDHGLVDFVICALSEANHADTDSEHLPCVQIQLERATQQLRAQFTAVLCVLVGVNNLTNENPSPCCKPEMAVMYAAPLLHSAPHRGPPSFSGS